MCRDAPRGRMDAVLAQGQESQGGEERRGQGRPTGGTCHVILVALPPDAGSGPPASGYRPASCCRGKMRHTSRR